MFGCGKPLNPKLFVELKPRMPCQPCARVRESKVFVESIARTEEFLAHDLVSSEPDREKPPP